VARPLWRAHNPAGHLERLLEQIVQEREVLHVRAGLGRRDQVDVQLGKRMRAQRCAVGLGQGGHPQALADPAGEGEVGLQYLGGTLAQVLGELEASDQVLADGNRNGEPLGQAGVPGDVIEASGSSSQ
jgi:hypothetical protein